MRRNHIGGDIKLSCPNTYTLALRPNRKHQGKQERGRSTQIPSQTLITQTPGPNPPPPSALRLIAKGRYLFSVPKKTHATLQSRQPAGFTSRLSTRRRNGSRKGTATAFCLLPIYRHRPRTAENTRLPTMNTPPANVTASPVNGTAALCSRPIYSRENGHP